MSGWNGRGRPPGLHASEKGIKPLTQTETTVTIQCPCGNLHNYGRHDLEPTPIYPGDWRAVICAGALSKERAGLRNIPARWQPTYDYPIFIIF